MLILALGLGLRLYRIGDESLWYDETVCARFLDAPTSAVFIEEVRKVDPPMTPVYFVLAYGWARYVSDSTDMMRCLSVLFSAGVMLLVYRLGLRMFGRAAGTTAMLCTALAPSLIYYGQEIRVYSLVLLLALLSFTSLRAWAVEGRAWGPAACVLVNWALAFTHLFAALVPIVQAPFVIALIRRRPKACIAWFLAHAACAGALLWWLSSMDQKALDGAAAWIPATSAAMFVRVVLGLFGAAAPRFTAAAWPAGAIAQTLFAWSVGAAAVIAAAAALRPGRLLGYDASSASSTWKWDVSLVAAWCLVPLAGLLVVSEVLRPCLLARYIIYCTPAVYLLVGAGVAALRHRVIAAAAAALPILLLGIGAAENVWSRPMRADWVSAGRYMAARHSEDASVYYVLGSGTSPACFRHYMEREGVRGTMVQRTEELFDHVRDHRVTRRDLWVVFGESDTIKSEPFRRYLQDRGVASEWTSFPSMTGPIRVCRVLGSLKKQPPGPPVSPPKPMAGR